MAELGLKPGFPELWPREALKLLSGTQRSYLDLLRKGALVGNILGGARERVELFQPLPHTTPDAAANNHYYRTTGFQHKVANYTVVIENATKGPLQMLRDLKMLKRCGTGGAVVHYWAYARPGEVDWLQQEAQQKKQREEQEKSEQAKHNRENWITLALQNCDPQREGETEKDCRCRVLTFLRTFLEGDHIGIYGEPDANVENTEEPPSAPA